MTGKSYVWAYACAIRSAQDLLTSYGCAPCNGVLSSYGFPSCSPYALSDDATMICFTAGLRRAASKSAHVPRTLVSNVETGLRLATVTIVWAARWITVSV